MPADRPDAPQARVDLPDPGRGTPACVAQAIAAPGQPAAGEDAAPVLHVSRLRVYYEDTDAGGIVYYANYLRFFERARSDWLRALGVTHRALAEREGVAFVVRDAAVRYLRPARLEDELDIDVRVAELGRVSMRIAQAARRAGDGALLAHGTVRVAVVDAAGGRPAALPRWLRERLVRSLADRACPPADRARSPALASAPDAAATQAADGADGRPERPRS